MDNLISIFEKQVVKSPLTIAVKYQGRSLNYEQLNNRVNAVANYLITEKSIGIGDTIPLLLSRTENIIIAMLAVLKTGAAYTALSKTYPEDRVKTIEKQIQSKLILDDEFFYDFSNQYGENPHVEIDVQSPAYLVYTSGTTGKPKGVIHTFESVFNHAEAYSSFLNLNSSNQLNMLLLVNYVFSVATTQIYTALLNGHTLVISEENCLEDIDQFTSYINDNRINYLQCTPSLADSLNLSKLHDLRLLAVAGEKLPRSLVKNSKENNIVLFNVYGQSEFHAATAKRVDNIEQINNIGTTFNGLVAYVLDEQLNQVRIGDIGELCISGAQLAKGYLNLSEETNKHFIDNPSGTDRICRTGDLVKKLENNEFEFIGRNDFQLNINGIRTEPSEIEKQINSIPNVKNSVVTDYKGRYIIAYYASEYRINDELFKNVMVKKLPTYMHPHRYIWLKALPLNENGKIDRKMLPEPPALSLEKSKEGLVTDTEHTLANAIKEVLNIKSINLLESFFSLGGTSLQAIKLANLVFEKTQKQLTTEEILKEQSIRALAKILSNKKIKRNIAIVSDDYRSECLMSPAQRRMFTLYELNKNTVEYNEQTILKFSEKLNVNKLEQSFKRMMEVHESLRTCFLNKEGRYIQKVKPNGLLDFEVLAYKNDLNALIKPFNLESGHTMRVRLLRRDQDDLLFVDKHHIITDGTSESIFYKELANLYSGQKIQNHKLHYRSYSQWFNKANFDQERGWWHDYLKGYQRLELVTDFPRTNKNTTAGSTITYSFQPRLLDNIRKFSKKNKASEYTLLFSAISILLSRIYHSKEFLIGTVANGRVRKETENMLGMFVNTLPVRVTVDTQKSFQEIVTLMNNNIRAALSNQNYQFDNIVHDFSEISQSRNPFFDFMYVYQDTSYQNYFNGKAQKISFKSNVSKFDLAFEIEDSGNSMNLLLNYNNKLFKEESVTRMLDNFLILLNRCLETPQISLSQVSLLSDSEKNNIIKHENLIPNKNVVKLIEQQVDIYPDNIALRFNDKVLTYAQLDKQVNQVANYLINQCHVQREQKIPLLLKRSEKMVIAILAVLKSGAAYVPISLKYPEDRIKFIVKACRTDFVIDDEFMNQSFPENFDRPNVSIEDNQLAYIIFTSGTTGRPKGVMVEHHNLSNYVVEVARMPKSGMTRGIINGAFFEYVFDASIHDLIRTFALGEQLVILDTNLIYDIDKFISTLNEYKINAIGMTPSLAEKVDLSKVTSLRFIHCGGEAITQEVIRKYAKTHIQVNNCYGPTETTILSFVNNDVHNSSIGRPIGGVYPYVLDDDNQLLPVGAIGNLYISGNQVTRGYLNQPDETAKHYLNNIFGEGLMYETGDLVRRLEDGSFEYFGRKDKQIKIRGFRIELTEVEKVLLAIDNIQQAAVVVVHDNLAAYYVAAEQIDSNLLRKKLSKFLPDYMVPEFYTPVESIPLTINGKLDVQELPKIDYEEVYVAPKSNREKEISQAVCDVLALEKVSVCTDFFRMGGNSISAISLASLIDVPVKDIFEQRTIRNLAKMASGRLQVTSQTFATEKDQVLSFAQERLFYIDQIDQGSQAYNIPILLTLNEQLDESKLESAIKKVVQRHEILRTIIKDFHQEVLKENVIITHNDINTADYFSYKFDLKREIPIKVNLYNKVLAINIHHIAFDGWSMNVFLNEIAMAYRGQKLSEMKLQYKDFAKWQRTTENANFLANQKDYWVSRLSGFEELHFPTDYQRPKEFDYKGNEFNYELDTALMNKLSQAAQNYDISLFTVTLSAFIILLSVYSNQKDVVLGTPVANRHIKGTENLVGFFVNTLALREKIDVNTPVHDLFINISQQIMEAQKYQDLPFEQLVDHLSVETNLDRNPIFQIMFGFQDVSDILENKDIYQSLNKSLNLNNTKFDLSVMINDNVVNFTYATSLFKRDTIQGIAKTYESILKQVADNQNQLISELQLVQDKREKVKDTKYSKQSIQQLFEMTASAVPNKLALVCGETKLSYKDLNEQANRFAHTLIDEYHIKPGTKVPILMSRSSKYVIAILGILKAGACYVPVSLQYPDKRIDYILSKIKSPFIVRDTFKVTSDKTFNPNLELDNTNLAYIIFTSGTTGKPKGVMIEHRNVINTVFNQISSFHISESDKLTHFADFVFDVSVFELFSALFAGATLYLLSQEERKDYQLLKEFMIKNQITVATIPPAVLNADDLLPLNILIVAGESTPKEIYQAYEYQGTTMINAYGPTEITIYATMKTYEANMDARNIGQPIKNVQAYVLDANHRELPNNAVGELYIGGAGLAEGYLDDLQKTEQAFIQHPRFGRIYKTGDLVKRLPTGDLICLGRSDFQVKVRGFRIELGEIESRLMEQKSISKSVAIVKGNNIVAYYTGKLDYHLDNVLPGYMVPSQYIRVESIPMTINGKIDLKNLPEPKIEQNEFVAPTTKREKEIAKVICELLRIERVSITDDFYKLGGNSILALRLANQIKIPVKQVFNSRSIKKMANISVQDDQLIRYHLTGSQSVKLSFAQESLWFIDQFEKNLTAYNIPLALTLADGVSNQGIERALKSIVKRHEVLRTVIRDGYQIVKNVELVVSHNEIDINEFISKPFNLAEEIPIRVNMYDNQVIISVHHIAFDGWSIGVFLKELNSLYYGEILPLSNQYRDYAIWQKEYLNDERVDMQTSYWKNLLAEFEPLNLPTDHERPKEFSYRGDKVVVEFKKSWQANLETMAKRYNTSLYTVMLTILDVLLSRYSYQQDIVVGTPFANRHIQGTENMIGFFINTLPVRTQVDEKIKFSELVSQNHKMVISIQNNQDLPLEKIVKALKVTQDSSRNPIFQVLFSVQNFVSQDISDLFTSSDQDINDNSAKYDLSVLIENNQIIFNYCTDIFDKATIQSMLASYISLIEQISHNAEQVIEKLNLPSKVVSGPKQNFLNKTVVELFSDQVKRTPDSVAIEYQDKQLTYSEFDMLTNRFANFLLNSGVKPGDKIPILLERSEKMSIAIWGILKSGCAYVPISPEFPTQRKQYILEQIKSPIIIDDSFEGFTSGSLETVDVKPSMKDLAYLIFTSGTTGNPKGVMIEHGGLSNRIQWMNATYPIGEDDKIFQKTNFVFDVSVWEQIWALLVGARIVFAVENGHKDPLYLINEIKAKHVTVMHFVPSMLDMFLDTLETYNLDDEVQLDISSLKYVFCSGEALSMSSVNRFKKIAPEIKLFNLYGPTEATIDVTAFDCNQANLRKVLIGEPVANTNCYVLSKNNRLQPVGAIGELAIGGIQIARGYINQPELTSKSFVVHPVFGRLYKTGDLVRVLDTGEIEYLGRNDFQVKIRGLRIELGEIEKHLLEVEEIQQAIVLKISNQLVAYYSGTHQLSDTKLSVILKALMPDYMVPSYFVFMSSFPLTINGKLDRKSLPLPSVTADRFIEPTNEIEKIIQNIFSEILDVPSENISIRADFFNLGGDSIKAIQLSNRIKQQLDKTISIKQVFDAKTVEKISKVIGKVQEVTVINEQGALTGSVPLLPIQSWFFEEYNTTHFNQAFAIQLPTHVDFKKLKDALIELVNYHDALRLSYKNGIQYYQSAIKNLELEFVTDINELNKIQSGFRLDGALYRFVIKKDENILCVICHHLVIDSVSWQIIATDLRSIYMGEKLAKKQTSYRQWGEALKSLPKQKTKNNIFIDNYKQSNEYHQVKITFNEQTTDDLLTQVNRIYHTKINDILLTALARTLSVINGRSTTSIKLESHGRATIAPQLNIQRTVGWFTTIYPQSISTSLQETKALGRKVSDYGVLYDMSYGIHSKYLPSVMFNYLGRIDHVSSEWSIVNTELGNAMNTEFRDALTINGSVYQNTLTFEFSGRIENIEGIAKKYKYELNALIAELLKINRTYLTADDINNIVSQKSLDKLQEEQELTDVLPANSLQKGFVYQSLGNTTNDDAYICSFIFEYNQMIDIDLYQRAWRYAQQKYPSLRLALNSEYEEIIQVIAKNGTLDFEYLEKADIDSVIKKERQHLFDLEQGSLFRVKLIKMEEARYKCVLTYHHAILDGWSNPNLLNFIHDCYYRLSKGQLIQFVEDKAYMEAQYYIEENKTASETYWSKNLKEVSHPDLTGIFKQDMRNTKIEKYDHIKSPKDQVFTIDNIVLAKLDKFAKDNKLTINIILQYLWHKTLSVYGGINETTVGVVNAGRNIPVKEIESSVGLFIRTLPVQFHHSNKSVYDQLHELQDLNNECVMNNNINLADLQKMGTRVFDTVFIYENYPLTKIPNDSTALKISEIDSIEKLDYPLTLVVYKQEDSLNIRMKYAAELFESSIIEKLFDFMNYLLEQLIGGEKAFNYVKQIPEFGQATYPKQTIIQLFEKQVEIHANDTALRFNGNSWTFGELNRLANRIAHTLIDNYGVQLEDKIPLLLSKSEKMIVAILGILKAGAVYVPMSPSFPKERIRYIQEKVEAKLTIDEAFMSNPLSSNESDVNVVVKPENMAYIIFTSGTTGKPKGVMVEHRNFICYLGNILAAIENTGTKEIEFGCIAEYVFDIFGTEVFGQLLRGKPINLFAGTPEEFPDFMQNNYVTTLQSTPGKISYLFQDNDEAILATSLTTIMVGGEKMNDSFAKRFERINLINIYGPTEGTVWTSMKRVGNNYSNIGTPFRNYMHFIMDDKMRLLPDGAVGELYVGGPQLSRGYYGQTELTNKQFVKNPYNDTGLLEYSRIYKTGDIVRRLLNKEFELIGRNDFQVKIRGFRIELGEVEAAMLKVPGVEQVLALALGEVNSKYLGVYYQSEHEIDRSVIETVISRYLTDYMMPSGYQFVRSFPLTINGKIDRRSLPRITYDNHVKYVRPKDEIETIVLNTVCEILSLDSNDVSVLESFFNIGGDSIKLIKLISLIKLRTGFKLTIKQVFENKTIQKIARFIQNNLDKPEDISDSFSVRKQTFKSDRYQKLSYAQHLYKQLPIDSYSNVKICFKLKPGIDARLVEKATVEVVKRQEILRTKIYQDYQIVDQQRLNVTHTDIDRSEYFKHVFNLENEIPIMVNIYNREFTCVIDHIAFDGWSTALFLDEIEAFYYNKTLPKLPYQYKDFAKCQYEFLNSSKKQRQLDYWKKSLSEFNGIQLSDKKISNKQRLDGADEYLTLEDTIYQKLLVFTKEHKMTLHNVLLGVFYLTISRISKQNKIAIAIPTFNRNTVGTENLIGMFVNQFLLQLDIDYANTFETFISQLNEKIVISQNNQDIPLEQMLSENNIRIVGNTFYFGMQGFKGAALAKSNLFSSVADMNQQDQKDAFSDLTIFVWGKTIDFNYAKALFSVEKIKQIMQVFKGILEIVIDDPGCILIESLGGIK